MNTTRSGTDPAHGTPAAGTPTRTNPPTCM